MKNKNTSLSKNRYSGLPFFSTTLSVLGLSLFALVGLVLVGWWGQTVVERKVRYNMQSRLGMSLQQTIKVVKLWEKDITLNARAMAANPLVRSNILELLRKSRESGGESKVLLGSRELKQLRAQLEPMSRTQGYIGFVVMDPTGLEVGALFDEPVGKRNLASLPEGAKLLNQNLNGDTVISLPFEAKIKLPVAGQEGVFRGKQPTMFVSTPVNDDGGKVVAALAFRMRPENEFTHIFEISREGMTGESYAFNESGKLITRSRFEAQLKQVGLIEDNPESRSLLKIEIRDPGGNLLEDFVPAVPRDQQPFTRMAESALKGESGFDFNGYNDYRGVPVVGAWEWLPEFGFGVTSEMDYEEAFSLLNDLRRLFFVLFGLLVVTSFLALRLALKQMRVHQKFVLSKEEAERANRFKSEFLSRISHDLRTPMNAILGFAQLMDMQPDDEISSTNKQNVGQILKAGNHLLHLIDEILDLSRIEAGEIRLELEDMNVSAIVEEAILMVQPMLTQQNVQVHNQMDPARELYAYADSTRLEESLVNLLSNAIKYNKRDGMVTVQAEEDSDGFLVLSITDSGKGIAPENLEDLFEPFNRLDSLDREGTGIGLSITKRLIELMGGTLSVKSEPGTGSCFTIKLPLGNKPGGVEAPLLISQNNRPSDKNAENSFTILYIEDNRANQELMKNIFRERSQIKLLSAGNARVGLNLAQSFLPDLILMDIDLPDMDGIATFKKLQEDVSTQTIPVLAVSSNAMKSDIDNALGAGFLDYIIKPINVSEFVDKVETLLEGKRLS